MEKWWNVFIYNNIEEILCIGVILIIIFSIVQLHKTKKIEKRINAITKGVEHYLAVVMEEEDASDEEGKANAKSNNRHIENDQKESEMEAQSSLISAVLQEIFP